MPLKNEEEITSKMYMHLNTYEYIICIMVSEDKYYVIRYVERFELHLVCQPFIDFTIESISAQWTLQVYMNGLP